VTVTTDRENPSWSAHQVTLTLPDVEPLILQVPWPFLANEVQISLHKNKGKKNRLRLVLNKSLHDPWPKEFGGRSKWNINCFRPWREIKEHGTLELHIDAQFRCHFLFMEVYTRRKRRRHWRRCVKSCGPFSTVTIATRFSFSLSTIISVRKSR